MDSGRSSDIKVSTKTSKTEVQLCIINIDNQLSELSIKIAKIQDNFHKLSHFGEGVNIDNLTKPGPRNNVAGKNVLEGDK